MCAHQIRFLTFNVTGLDYYSRPEFLSTDIIRNYQNAQITEIKRKTIAALLGQDWMDFSCYFSSYQFL